MKVYFPDTVLIHAKQRIAYLFDEFEVVVVGISGGKDSTVVLNLALEEAERRGRLPLPVMFLDQEAEWQVVIDHLREVFSDPRIEPYWLQVPIKLFNATSSEKPWLQCWDPEDEENWMRPKESFAIKENVYGTERFAQMFTAFFAHHWPDQSAAYLSGVRTEESPARAMGLTSAVTYKWITWGKILNKSRGHYTFYPVYDWSYTDIWKAIFEHKWPYCKIYDYMYQYGVPTHSMRVSNLHHETAVDSLFYLQEIERETWNKLTQRLQGVNTAGKMGKSDFFAIKELPYMFTDWKEYRDYLLAKLIVNDEVRDTMAKKFEYLDKRYGGMADPYYLIREQLNTILTNDYHFTKLTNFERRPEVNCFRKFVENGVITSHTYTNTLIPHDKRPSKEVPEGTD